MIKNYKINFIYLVFRPNLNHVHATKIPTGLHVSPSCSYIKSSFVYSYSNNMFCFVMGCQILQADVNCIPTYGILIQILSFLNSTLNFFFIACCNDWC